MRVLTAIVSVLLLTACGSGAPTDTKPVPVVLVPATVAVTAGDGQQAVPGASLSIKPVVTVKDASGQPVPGTSVAFAVDSGGGSVQAATASTASDGTASPGDWKMGPTEARNVLRVTVGALPPVRILALGAMAPVIIPDLTVGSGGGTVTVTKPGAPIDGMKIVVPAGAFASGQTVGITYGSALGVRVPAGVTIISPLLTFRTSDGGLATSPMLITIPVTVPVGSVPGILLRDAASGRQELLTTVSYTTTSVTAMTGHLNGALLMGSDGSFLASASKRRDTPALGIAGATGTAAVIALPEEFLELDHDTGFRPGVDSWEFKPIETAITSEVGPAMVATEAWYYVAKKSANGPLWKKYQEAEGVEMSNRRGLRWISLGARGRVQWLRAAISIVTLLGPGASGDALTTAERVSVSSFNAVRTSLTLDPGTPEPVVLSDSDNFTHGVALLLYRSTGNRLFAVDPGNPSQTIALDFSSGKMAPVTLTGAPGTYKYLFATGFALIGTAAELPTQWPAVADGTIGNGVFPTFKAQVGWGSGATDYTEMKDPVYVFDRGDSVTVWADCESCLGLARPIPLIPPGSAEVAGMYAFYRATSQQGAWAALGTAQTFASSRSAPGTSDVGIAFAGRNLQFPSSPIWIDWVSAKHTRLDATITPTAPTANRNTDVALTLTVTGAPANLEYVWEFTDGTAQAITTTPAVTHQWTSGGSYIVKVTARDKTTKQPVAKATTTVTVTGDLGYSAWVLTSVTTTTSGTVGTPGPNNEAGLRARRAYDATLASWSRPVAGAYNPTLWYVTNAVIAPVGGGPVGLYYTDSLPGSAANGRDPRLLRFVSPVDTLSNKVADDPIFNPKWQVTGTPPTSGSLMATGTLPPNYQCGADFFSAWTSTSVTFTMNDTQGSGDITYTYRDLTPSCTRPNVEAARWKLIVTFQARRVR